MDWEVTTSGVCDGCGIPKEKLYEVGHPSGEGEVYMCSSCKDDV